MRVELTSAKKSALEKQTVGEEEGNGRSFGVSFSQPTVTPHRNFMTPKLGTNKFLQLTSFI